MVIFGRKDATKPLSSLPSQEEEFEQIAPTDLSIYIPESLVTSDIKLSALSKDALPDGTGKKFSNTPFYLSDMFWFIQQKEAREDSERFRGSQQTTVRLDKFMLKLSYGNPETPLYIMADIFFDPVTSYTAKALGLYSSVPKILSVNFKHHGELHAERRGIPKKDWSNKIKIVPDNLKLEKRARAMFFWLEVNEAF